METFVNRILTLYKRNLDIDAEQEAVVHYAIQLVTSTVLAYLLALVVAWPLHIFWDVLVMMLTISVFRNFSGGAHCSCARNCITYGVIIMNSLGMISHHLIIARRLLWIFTFIIFLFSIWAVHRYAPADTPGKPISTKVKKERLRKRSFLMVCLWYIGVLGVYVFFQPLDWMIYASSFGMLWQSFTLTKLVYGFLGGFDKVLNKIL